MYGPSEESWELFFHGWVAPAVYIKAAFGGIERLPYLKNFAVKVTPAGGRKERQN